MISIRNSHEISLLIFMCEVYAICENNAKSCEEIASRRLLPMGSRRTQDLDSTDVRVDHLKQNSHASLSNAQLFR
jgi:nicotinic acid phosphoribosyltransferase